MKLKIVKQEVYSLTCTKNTQELKKERRDLTSGKDLRCKLNWVKILEQIKLPKQPILNVSLKDLLESEKMLKKSLISVGKLAGLNDDKIEIDWQRIQLESQFTDIHIEEL